MLLRIRLWSTLAILLLGCDGGGGDPDASMDAAPACTADSCDDGQFCNGVETCGGDGACAPGTAPCAACDEDTDLCDDCATMGDADGDGATSLGCGGDDCDDNDARRFPGATEICDAENIDEDCDDTTIGEMGGDRDGDGYISQLCCNGTRCGDDCDDTRIAVNPGAGEICNEVDDDCNGTIDEGVLLTFYRDVDGDNYGDDSMTTLGCSATAGFTVAPGDCDDMSAARNPGNPEDCATPIDDNCDEMVNEECACTGSETRACPDALGACAAGTETCTAGTFSGCSIGPVAEVCGDGTDQNCNGTTDDEIEVGEVGSLGPPGSCDDLRFTPAMLGGTALCSTPLFGGGVSGVSLSRASSRRGAAAYYDDSLELGYGELSFAPTVAITAPSDPGFLQSGLSLVIADDPPGELLGTVDLASTPTGVPFRRTGLALEWWFYVPFVGDDDRLVIRQLTGTGNGTVLGTCSVPASAEIQAAGTSEHVVELRYRPANRHTGATKRVQVWLDGAMVCETLDPRLPDWSQGQELYVGMTGENQADPGVSIRWVRAEGEPGLAPVELAGSCP